MLGREVVEQVTQGKTGDIGADHPGVELGDIHQRAEQALDAIQGVADVMDQRACARLFEQGTGKQPGGIQRLQQVMADCGEKFGFRKRGLLGIGLGIAQAGFHTPALVNLAQQLAIEAGQFGGALVHAQFQVLIGLMQRFGMGVALGDIGEGVDETACGQWMRTNFQHAPVEQALLQLRQRLAVVVAAGGRQQGQLAVGNHVGKLPMAGNRCQAADLEKASVPQLKHALGVDHGQALRQVVDRPLQQVRLMRQGLLAAVVLTQLDPGDVGEKHHPAAIAGRPFADLQPALVAQPIQRLLVAAGTGFFAQQVVHQAFHLDQLHTAGHAQSAVGPERLEAPVVQHHAQVGIEQHERIGNTLDGIHQPLVGGFGALMRVAEQQVAGLEFDQYLVQGISALAHLLGQHHRMLERGKGIVRPRRTRLQPLDQRCIDALELVVVALQLADLLSWRCARGAVRWQRR